jgi:UPF0755 protein
MIVKRICRRIAFALAFVLVLFGLAAGLLLYANSPPAQAAAGEADAVTPLDDGKIRLEIREGESADSVGARLEDARLIRSEIFWQILCRARSLYLKAGMYQFERGLSLLELYELFTAGKQMLFQVTIPEGSTIKKTAAILEKAGICKASAFIEAARSPALRGEFNIPGATLEGYLYPDTYYFTRNYPAEKAARAMVLEFYRRLGELGLDAPAIDANALYEKVILASIVEREYRIAEEAPVMAGVFLNRLKKGMRLESCATVVYALTEIEGREHPQRLFNRDLETDSAYNTYRHSGLPPGPISSPGAEALLAAFKPAETPYLFFRVIDPKSGRHYFSTSFDSHIKAGALLVK